MAAFEVIALDPATPQLRAPGPADTYTFPRAVAMSVALPVSSGGTGTSTPSLVAGTNVTITGSWPNQTISASGGGSATLTFNNITGAYTVVIGDLGKIVNCTANTFTVSLTAAASLGSGFNCWIWNTGTGVITIDPNGSETIDGSLNITLRRGEGTQIVCNGSNWETGDKKTMRAYSENISAGAIRPIASGVGAVAIGAGAFASASTSIALGQSATASGQSSFATPNTTAGSLYSTAIGMNSAASGSVTSGNDGAMALGGSYASGIDSFAAAVANNTSSYGATGTNALAIGNLAKATATSSVAISAANATASGAGSFAAGGYNYGVTASGLIAVAIGDDNEATGIGSVALGYGASSVIRGKLAFGNRAISGRGLSQCGTIVLAALTTSAAATVLTSDAGGAANTNQVILPNNSAFAFTGTIIARQQAAGGSDYAAWEIKGAIIRGATAASTTLGSFNVNRLSTTAGASAWTVGLSADTTNGGLAVTVTGAASTNIRWVATVQTSEVTYA